MKKILQALLILLVVATANAKTFYVSPSASAGGDGSQTKPFARLEEARDEIRKLQPISEPMEVVVMKGTFYLAEPFVLSRKDSGSDLCPVVWRTEAKQQTRLSGGKLLRIDKFLPFKDESVLSRMAAPARTEVLVLDLAEQEIPALKVIPVRMRMPLPVPELFLNGKRMPMANWPNEGFAAIRTVIDSGTRNSDGTPTSNLKPEPPRGGTFEYTEDAPGRWPLESGIWLHGFWCYDWSDEVIRVKSIDQEKKQITLAAPHGYGLRKDSRIPRRWRVVHLLEELDIPGEYFVDQAANRLYFYPPVDLKDATLVLAFREAPIVQFEDAKYITLNGFCIEESYTKGIEGNRCESVRIENCKLRNMRNSAIMFENSTRCTVNACLVEETGTGGISVGGGDRKTLTPAGNVIENCVVRKFSEYQLCYASGIALRGVGCIARHNDVSDSTHLAISVAGNNHVFEYNIVRDICLTGDDCGAFYKGRNPSCRGNVIRYNYWSNIGNAHAQWISAVYFDDGDGGEKVYGNVFYKAGPQMANAPFGAVFSHGGHDNVADNNIFVDCLIPFAATSWNEERWNKMVAADLWQRVLFKEVDITSEVYTASYPELKNFMNNTSDKERRNIARKNVIVNSSWKPGKQPRGNWDLDDSNWIMEGDPGFVDMDKQNFLLRPDSEVFKKIPDFQQIPFDKIGPQ